MNKKVIVATLIIIIFIITNKIFFFKQGLFERCAGIMTYPVIVFSEYTQKSFNEIFFKEKPCCCDKNNKTLQKQYNSLFKKYVKLQATALFENKTRELLEFKKRYDLENACTARIISKNFSTIEHSFLVNRGKRDGIKKDMVAIYKLQILGKVTDVYDFYSKIQSITDKRCNIASFTNTTNAQGITGGINQINKCNLNYVSYTSNIIQDDLVFCSGQGKIFPQGFCLGTVKEQTISKNEAYHKIEIEPLIDFTTLEFCSLTDISKINLF